MVKAFINNLLFFLIFAVCSVFSTQTVTAQEDPINRFLKIELSEGDYEILNLEDGIQYQYVQKQMKTINS